MAWRLAHSLSTLRNQVNAAHPNRSKVSDGTIGDARHSSTISQHNPNSAGVVTAIDITHDPVNGVDGQTLADSLILDPRAWYVIFNRRIRYNGGGWQAYNGSNPHTKHVHLSTKQTSAQYDNASNWNIGGSQVAIIQDAPNWYARLNKLHWQVRGRELSQSAFKQFVGKDTLYYIEQLSDDPEANKVQEWQTVGKTAVTDKWANQIYALQDKAKELSTRPTKEERDALQAEVDKLTDLADKAQREVAELKDKQSQDTILLDEAGNWFTKLIKRLFNKEK